MRRQIGQRAQTCIISSGLPTAGLASYHHHHPANNREKTVEAPAATAGAAVALTPSASTAYKQTVQFARDKLFTTNHRTTEYFASNEKQILKALRGVIKEVLSGLSPLDEPSATPFWLATTVEAPEGGSNAPTTLVELSTQFYKELGLTSVFDTNAVVAASSSNTSSADLTGQIRNLLALRSHHGLVLTDQMLVLALLALSAPTMTQYPEATCTVTSPTGTKGSASDHSDYVHQRVLTVAELGGMLPASATSPTVPTSGIIEGTFPSACLDVLRVIAEDQRLPLHPLVLSAVTSIIRGMEASTAGRFLRYRGGDELPEAGGASSRLAQVASSSTSNSSQHLSHPMQYIVAYHLKPLLRHLVALHVLVDPNSESSAATARMYYGDGSSDSLAAQWFGGGNDDTSLRAEIDLLSLFRGVVDESVSADSQPFRRHGADKNGSRQLSALERSMLGGGETLVSSSAAADKISKGEEGSQHALKISTKVNIKVLHLRLLSALAELAATLACRDVLEIVMHTLMSVHADVFRTCLQPSSAHHEQGVVGCLAEALPVIDTTLQLLGYGFFMSDYAGAGRGEARSTPSVPLFMSRSASSGGQDNHPLADTLWTLVNAQPAATAEGQSASRFLSVFPNAGGYWAAYCSTLRGNNGEMNSDESAKNVLDLLAEASSSASVRSESALRDAVKKELEAVMAHAAAVASTQAYCYSQLFPAHNGLVGLFPQIVDGEGDAALKALEELRTAEHEQLFDGLLSYLASDLIGPCSQRIHEALAMVSSASAEEGSADLIALDAVVSTNLRSIVEIIDAVLIADANDSSEETANSALSVAHRRSGGARNDPRMVGYAVERFENLGLRLFGDEPAYASITEEMLGGRGDAAELMADAYPKTVFKASEYDCWQSFLSNLLTEVVGPVCESEDLHLQPRTIDLLVALQRRLLGISTAMAEAEMSAAESLQAVDSAVGDLTAAISCSTELFGFIKSVSLPKLSSAVVAGVERSSSEGASAQDESAALVGAIAQLAVSADALEATAKSLRNKSGASVDDPSLPLISTVIKPMMKTLFAAHLAAHAEEMQEAHKAAVGVNMISHSNDESLPKKGPSSEDVLTVSGRRKSATSTTATDGAVLVLPPEGLAAVPVAEVFRPLSSFTRLFEAARAAEDTELCLMLRSLRTTLFN